ncbi:MAG: AI-2E family transporter, partial [Oscillospiraceae bacterium]|nr:AI-2E family transporter [Oscillospiraceae bacterium]
VVYTDRVAGVLGAVLSVLFPIILGLSVAYIINIPMSAIEGLFYKAFKNKRFSDTAKTAVRICCIIFTILLLCAILTAVVVLIVPELVASGRSMLDAVAELPSKLEQYRGKIEDISPKAADFIFNFDKQGAIEKAFEWLLAGSGTIMGIAFGAVKSAVKVVYYFVTTLLIIVWVLKDKEKIAAQIKKIMVANMKPKTVEKLTSSLAGISKVFRSFFTGQCVEACILGSMFLVTMTILRFPYALMISVLITVTALIPIFGAFIGLAVGVVLMVIETPIKALWFIVLFFALQQFEGNVIYPKVVGGSVGLPPLFTLLAVFIGGDLMGLLGMILFIPMLSVVYSALKSYVNKRVTPEMLEESVMQQ